MILVIVFLVMVISAIIISAFKLKSLNLNIIHAWAHFESLIKQRNDIIKDFVARAKNPLCYENIHLQQLNKAVDNLNQAIQCGDTVAIIKAEQDTQAQYHTLTNVLEAYPEIVREPQLFRQLTQLKQLQTSLFQQQELYNEAILDYNHYFNKFILSTLHQFFGLKNKKILSIEYLN